MGVFHSDITVLHSFLGFQNQRLCTSWFKSNPLKFRHLQFAFHWNSWSKLSWTTSTKCPPVLQWGRCIALDSLCNQDDQETEGDWVNHPRSFWTCLTEPQIEIRTLQKVNKSPSSLKEAAKYLVNFNCMHPSRLLGYSQERKPHYSEWGKSHKKSRQTFIHK